jgi:hypothetical protein
MPADKDYPEDRLGEWPRWYRMDAAKRIHRVYSITEAGCALAAANRVVGLTKLDAHTSVATVFLCFDHARLHFPSEWQGEFAPPKPEPVVFETVRFDENGVCILERYSSYAQAETGHVRYVIETRRNLRESVMAVTVMLARLGRTVPTRG